VRGIQHRAGKLMKQHQTQLEFATEVFVRGHSAVKSRTHPYDADRVGPAWVMRDAPRKNARDYRKEEWVASGVEPAELSRIAKAHTRGHYFLCDLLAEGHSDAELRDRYKSLGYRLVATEGFFIHDLARVPRRASDIVIERVRDAGTAARLAKVTRTRPIAGELLGEAAPFRQFVALDGREIVGRVRSVDASGATWCTDMYVSPSHRRRGIGQALLAQMLRDDRARHSKCSVLTASHTGALLYPRVGYVRLGTLFMFVPRRGFSPPDER
jgi:GNAT superfamily N-acetyltransferase